METEHAHCWHIVEAEINATNIPPSICCWCGRTTVGFSATMAPVPHGDHAPPSTAGRYTITWRSETEDA